MGSLVFLDVDQEDRASVEKAFPDASVFAHLEEGDLIKACADASAVSAFITTPFPRAVLNKLPKLKLIVTRSVGFDHVDLEAAQEKGIVVCNVPDYGSHVIAEHVFALLLSTLRHVHEGHERVAGGTFDYHGLRGMALKGKTIGIVGTGKIGRAVARIAHGFGMNILAADQCRTIELEEFLGVRYVTLLELLAHSDIVTLHVPGTPETRHMIDAPAFDAMKNGAVLVNTARGSLIDTSALLAALDAKKISWVLLDVLEHEQNFAENAALVKHPRVVTTPHIAFYADDSMRNMYGDAFQSISEWSEGKAPSHVVQPVRRVCDLPPIRRDS